ncbi:glycoside hydrolase family 37 [Capsulimonas corticalis]|uniref:Glycoside hydrolase family 37 n=1 Tax=Capsulimonas corticalis TaxID=2219043 RepID=A0A402CR19_9BACT|nr:trehalase family glycosidase [Capsulimonas corticalis]BDI27954.1 glycoside hydrolase family 37 [Capsulimonas corticalis]
MHLDLTQVPFSRAGSYLALSLRDPDDARPWEQRPGDALYLRTIHGDRETDRVFRLEMLSVAGEESRTIPFEVEASPHLLRLRAGGGAVVDICLTSANGARLRGGGGAGLRLTLEKIGSYGNAQPFDREGRWLINAWPVRMTYLLSPLAGRMAVTAPVKTMRAERIGVDLLPTDEGGGFETLIEEFLVQHPIAASRDSFDRIAAEAGAEFEAFLAAQPPVPGRLQSTADLMAYVQWSAVAAPEGHLKRPAMLMSKNHMTNVWSWDHCFNALALTPHAPGLAWDQFRIPFDHQDAAGALPDSVNDKSVVRSFTKPPIHGWALRGLRESDRLGYFTDDVLAEIYEPLSRWTRWWLTERDQDADGAPQYNHGNDSGWDNCTVFDVGFPLEGPDLSAFLILQMDALADLAARLGRIGDSERWTRQADGLLERMMAHFWRGDRFVAVRSEDHTAVAPGDCDSLFPFLPLVLGDRLPMEARAPLIAGLLAPGRFLTEYGLATEAISSPQHEADGYWRGPIWAPPVLLIADGLRRMGETAAARDIAERFCRVVARSGAAENFHAQSGAGLRDRAYTWTASVFLILARGYLSL